MALLHGRHVHDEPIANSAQSVVFSPVCSVANVPQPPIYAHSRHVLPTSLYVRRARTAFMSTLIRCGARATPVASGNSSKREIRRRSLLWEYFADDLLSKFIHECRRFLCRRFLSTLPFSTSSAVMRNIPKTVLCTVSPIPFAVHVHLCTRSTRPAFMNAVICCVAPATSVASGNPQSERFDDALCYGSILPTVSCQSLSTSSAVMRNVPKKLFCTL